MSRSLGTLTLDLITKIGGWTKGLTEAERIADSKQKEIVATAKKRAKEFENEWKAATKLVAGAFGAFTIGTAFNKFIKETVEAEQAQTQLAAALRSTGGAAGFSQDQLNAMAKELSGIIPDTDSITRAQTVLLKYGDVIGGQFTRALQLAGDMAARTGESIDSAADVIGKALNAPAEGLGRLRKLGLNFTDAQVTGLQVLVDTGRKAEAQSVILDGLAKSYGGAAAAARDTLGGSLVALREAFNDLLTGGRGVEGMREGLESLTRTLQSQAVREGFAFIIRGLAAIAEGTTKAITAFSTFGTVLGQQLARAAGAGSTDPLERLNTNIDLLKTNISSLDRGLAQSKPGTEPYKEMSREVARLSAELEHAIKTRDRMVREANNPVQPSRPSSGVVAAPSMAELEALAARDAANKKARASLEATLKATDAYIKQLQNQINNLDKVTVYERTLQQIREGALKGPRLNEALELAKQVDLLKEKSELLDIIKRNNEVEDKATERVKQDVEELTRGSEAMREEIKLIGLEGAAREAMVLQLEKEAIARKELELIELQNAGVSTARIEALQHEIELLRQRSGLRAERDEKSRIGGLVKSGPNAQAEEQLRKAKELKDALDVGKIELAQYEDALDGVFGKVGDGVGKTKSMAEELGLSFTSAFEDAIVGGKGLRETLKGLQQDILRIVTRKMVTEPLGNAITKMLGGSGGIGDGIGKFFGNIFSGIFGRAAGGPVTANTPYWVGERGVPELFVPRQSGTIMTADSVGGSMVPSVNLTQYFNIPPGTDYRTQQQIGSSALSGAQWALARNG